jgi:hypothetical protein
VSLRLFHAFFYQEYSRQEQLKQLSTISKLGKFEFKFNLELLLKILNAIDTLLYICSHP